MESKRYYVSNHKALRRFEFVINYLLTVYILFLVAVVFEIMELCKFLFDSLSLLPVLISVIIGIPYITFGFLLINKSYKRQLQNNVPSSLTFSDGELILKFVTGRELKLKREDIFEIVPASESKKFVTVKILVRKSNDTYNIKEFKILLWRKNYEILEKWFSDAQIQQQ